MPRLLLLLVIFAFPAGLNSTEADPGNCNSELCRLVASGSLADLRWPDFSDYRARIQSFYEPTSYAFAWSARGVATKPAKSIIEWLQDADSKGLRSDDYDGSRWTDRLTALSRDGNASESDLARFDLALTVCVMRYISDLHFGKVNPGVLHTEFDLDREKQSLATFVREQLVRATSAEVVLQGIEPPYEGYRRTEQVLRQYLAMSSEDIGLLPVTSKPVEPGAAYPAVARLATILRRLGDLPADAALPSDSNAYAGPLVDAVRRFQERHGLEPDGRIGKATLAQLNTPVSQRIRQLQLTLERWRWVPHSFPVSPIVVNIPEFQLRALNAAYGTELEMKVVVGKAYHHQTPVFSADMKYVVFRPYWDVPVSIERAELVPKLAKDRSYLATNDFEIVTAKGEVVSKGVVDDAMLARLRSAEWRIRQVPGPENSLGLVKFLFPNDYSVYLHGTPATELFSKSRRDFSHGCIRVEKPEELAAWVLRDKPEWTPERIHEAMTGEQTIQVTLDRPIPVLVVYATAVALANGEVRFLEDIYQQDAELERLLVKGYPYSPWKPNSGKPTSAEPGRHPRE
ncbi:MAG TPA: L,D-transpeptidase family protein [Bryobacteraceae bacterium]|nr:L,D-transpeptidase family protein [Bryobacteraceae bacterium]